MTSVVCCFFRVEQSEFMEFSEVGVVDELGSLSNYHGNSNENLTQKTSFTFLKLLRYYPELSGS